MEVFQFYSDVDVWSTLFPDDEDEDVFALEHVKQRSKGWVMPTVNLSAVRRAKHGDFRDLHSGQWAVTPRAADALRPFFDAAGELLPILVDDGAELFWFNCTRIITAFDPQAGRIDVDEITRFAFHASSLAGVGLFRLPAIWKRKPKDVDTWVFSYHQFLAVHDNAPEPSFHALIQTHGLKGLELRKVWSSEKD